MANEAMEQALVRAERALARIERVAGQMNAQGKDNGALRERVRGAIAELDRLITRAEA